MPGIAKEVRANTVVVSIIQTMRVFLVILIIPSVVSSWASSHYPFQTASSFEIGKLLWTMLLIGIACSGHQLAKYLKIPAPWLMGSMVGVTVFQSSTSFYMDHDFVS
ncbi:AbrB family transcriptional regulator [Peribacillus muralis]|uniref:AbrB family transcriptional regulator n=1 Tax=Peribacillus muralis TaxID=264697 RepID=UPI0037FB61CB